MGWAEDAILDHTGKPQLSISDKTIFMVLNRCIWHELFTKENHKTVKIFALLKFHECFQFHIFYPITEPTPAGFGISHD